MTKLQKAVVNWLKKNVPVKKTKFAHTHVVQYFSAGRALDALMKVSSLSQNLCSYLLLFRTPPGRWRSRRKVPSFDSSTESRPST